MTVSIIYVLYTWYHDSSGNRLSSHYSPGYRVTESHVTRHLLPRTVNKSTHVVGEGDPDHRHGEHRHHHGAAERVLAWMGEPGWGAAEQSQVVELSCRVGWNTVGQSLIFDKHRQF